MEYEEFYNYTVKFAAEHLKNGGVENALQEARWLFKHVFGAETSENDFIDTVRVKCSKRLSELVLRRVNGEPLQYLLGEWEFYGYPMHVGSGVLIPRPETEFLVDAAKSHLVMRKAELIKQNKVNEADNLSNRLILIDLCAGSGCVSVAMCKETGCRSLGVEISEAALSYAEKNIALNSLKNRIKLIHSDIFNSALIEAAPQADFILANPPYLSKKDMEELQREVDFEPETALYGGMDGLDFYRRIFIAWKHKLKAGGFFAVEIGYGQAEAVSGFMREAGFSPSVMKDYSGIKRIVYAEYK